MHANRHPFSTKEYISPKKMGVYQQYHSKKYPNSSSSSTNRHLNFSIPSTSSFLYDKNDVLSSNLTELNLLHTNKSSLMTSSIPENHFLKVLPCIRRLYMIFNSICPNIYRIHCSDSLRILQELLCLIEEYLHLVPPSTIVPKDLLSNDDYFDDFLDRLRSQPTKCSFPKRYASLIQPEIRCFGQGIHSSNERNRLNDKLVFCFELTTTFHNPYFYPIEVIIFDPKQNRINNDIQLINTYDHGYTRLYSCSYKPMNHSGNYQISFVYNRMPINTEPFAVFIRNSSPDKELNIQETPPFELEGDGYAKNVIVNSIARFRLRTTTSFKSSIDLFSLEILDPYGHPIVVQRRLLSHDVLELTYQPMSVGEHKLSVLFDKKLQQQLVIHVIHDDTDTETRLKTFGPGLYRAIAGLPTEFYIDLNQQIVANHNPIQFSLEPSYQAEVDYEQQMATVRYTPLSEGDCPIHILEYNRDILHSPFHAQVTKISLENDKPKIFVTGLTEQIIIHRPVEFQIRIDNPFADPIHTVHVDIITAEKSPTMSLQRQDATLYTCSFLPTSLGRHMISIDYAGIVAENNPFTCEVIQEKDIQLTGPAMTNQCLTLNEPTHFYFKLKDFLPISQPENNLTYESGYSSNEETSTTTTHSSSETRQQSAENLIDESNYRVTITDSHGNVKQNTSIKNLHDQTTDNVRVDFTPDEQILYINISCTW